MICSCKNNSLTESDKIKSEKLINKAVDYRIKGDLLESKKLYEKAFELDKTNLNIHQALIGIYVQKGETQKAFKFLDKLSEKQKESVYYYRTKGNLFEYDGKNEKAKEQYKMALDLSEIGKIKNEQDLNKLINYAMLETFAGYKDSAVNRLNEVLKFEWLNKSDKEHLETFRNEFEYYEGNGELGFQNKKVIKICTKNVDSLEQILKENHINISGSSSSLGRNKTAEIRVNEKYRSGIEMLGIKECE